MLIWLINTPVTYDSNKEDAFIVHLPHKQVKFTQENGLYVYRLPYVKQPTIKDSQVQFLETVDENKKYYSKHQFEHAKQAHKLLYSLGYPLINNMKAIIWMDALKNNPVTTEDVDNAEKIFGPDDTALLERKDDFCRAPFPLIEHHIKIPRELITTQYSVTLCLNGMKVNDIPS
jgi:hypothetical protein